MPDYYTYSIPEKMDINVGDLVVVPFRNREMRGVVVEINSDKPKFQTKPISEKTKFFLGEDKVKIAKWISDKYFCPLNKALRLFLPKYIWQGVKMQTDEFVKLLDKDFEPRKNAEKQIKLIKKLEDSPAPVDISKLDIDRSVVKKLEEKGVVEIIQREIQLSQDTKMNEVEKITLTLAQQKIVDEVLNNNGLFLLHGILSSGKTAIYREVAKSVMDKGGSAIILVPEISLTPQLCNFFRGYFGEKETAVWHSGLTEKERALIWKKAYKGEVKIIIGSRSALFAPLKNLKLVVLDEEHEWTYKQDQSPRYDTREVVKKFHETLGIKVLYGSATPSMERYYEAKKGEIKLVELLERLPQAAPLPEIEIVDLRPEVRRRDFQTLSLRLTEKIQEALDNNEQVLLFLNRRGRASAITCRDCGYTMVCPHCEVALTYHANDQKEIMLCHLCGHFTKPETACPECKGVNLKHLGGGTQKLENELKTIFPDAKILRADKDTVTHHDSFKKIYQKMQNKEADILVGTQMIAQGLDFPGVKLVGIVLADVGLHLPDFRTSARMFSLLSQVAGRSGRREKKGEVFVQTFNPDNPVFSAMGSLDYESFYNTEIKNREEHNFPPFRRVAKLIIVNRDKEKAFNIAKRTAKLLENNKAENDEIFMTPALYPKKHNQYYFHVLIFSDDPSGLLKKVNLEKGIRIDIDPVDSV